MGGGFRGTGSSTPPAVPRAGLRPQTLTDRQMDVLMLLARGMTSHEIAGELRLSPLTIQSHKKAIYKKLGIHNRVAATLMALGINERSELGGHGGRTC